MASAARRAWRESRAKNGALLVLMAIAFESDKGGEIEMSVAELARKARLSERAARNGVRELEELKEVVVTPAKGGRSRYALTADPGRICRPTPADSAAPADIAGVPTPADIAGVKTDIPQASMPTPADSAGVKISDVSSTNTGRSVVDVKEVSEVAPERADVDRLCRLLADRIEGNGSKRPAVGKKWRDSARLMLDKDGHSEQQVAAAINWSQDHEFWRSNIMSMPKLREKYDQLRLQAIRERNSGKPKATTNDRVRQAREAGQRVAAMMNGSKR